MSTAWRKFSALERAWRLYLQHPNGLSDVELAALLDISVSTACRYRNELGCKIVSHGKYTIEPSDDDIRLAQTILERANKNIE